MAVEVWTDVLSFVKRVELAEVSLTNWQIHQISWRVMRHEVGEMIIASRPARAFPYFWSWLWSPTAILLSDGKEVPFANCPPPEYITGFRKIKIM
jgi:hypothetical protein